jgi:hypothetical protein
MIDNSKKHCDNFRQLHPCACTCIAILLVEMSLCVAVYPQSRRLKTRVIIINRGSIHHTSD